MFGFSNLHTPIFKFSSFQTSKFGFLNLETSTFGFANLETSTFRLANLEASMFGFANLETSTFGVTNLDACSKRLRARIWLNRRVPIFPKRDRITGWGAAKLPKCLCVKTSSKSFSVEKPCASSWGQSSARKYFLQVLYCKVALYSFLCKFCRAKWYWEVLCASFIVQRNIAKSWQ